MAGSEVAGPGRSLEFPFLIDVADADTRGGVTRIEACDGRLPHACDLLAGAPAVTRPDRRRINVLRNIRRCVPGGGIAIAFETAGHRVQLRVANPVPCQV